VAIPATAPTTHVDVGSTFGPYEIVARLTGGGMASVFLARRRGAAGFTRPVGIKVIHPHLVEGPGFVEMFIDEAKLAAKIQHPNVVHVEELGERDGVLFIAMEFVLGASLSQLLKTHARSGELLDPALVIWIAMQTLSGLHAAHEIKDAEGKLLGLVHRDVSPQNILLTADGNVKVIDFGIAKARGRQYKTETGSLKGKLRYMAPEQASSGELDRRTDCYALAIIIWEMLTLRRLFDAEDDFALIDQIRNPVVRPPSQLVPGVTKALDAVLLRALAPVPSDRYPSALEFRRALAQAMPSVASVDANRVADLLEGSLGPLMAERRELLASCVEGGPVAPSPSTSPDDMPTRSSSGADSRSGMRPATAAGMPAVPEAPKSRVGAVALAILAAAAVTAGLTFALHTPNPEVSAAPEAPAAAPVVVPAVAAPAVAAPDVPNAELAPLAAVTPGAEALAPGAEEAVAPDASVDEAPAHPRRRRRRQRGPRGPAADSESAGGSMRVGSAPIFDDGF